MHPSRFAALGQIKKAAEFPQPPFVIFLNFYHTSFVRLPLLINSKIAFA